MATDIYKHNGLTFTTIIRDNNFPHAMEYSEELQNVTISVELPSF